MNDSATEWKEIYIISCAWTDLVANQVELAWLPCYPLSRKIIASRGNNFLAKFRDMITNIYCIKIRTITSRNPQTNLILERVHQTIGNNLRTFKV